MMYSSQNVLPESIKLVDIIFSLQEIRGIEKHIKYYLKEANRQKGCLQDNWSDLFNKLVLN